MTESTPLLMPNSPACEYVADPDGAIAIATSVAVEMPSDIVIPCDVLCVVIVLVTLLIMPPTPADSTNVMSAANANMEVFPAIRRNVASRGVVTERMVRRGDAGVTGVGPVGVLPLPPHADIASVRDPIKTICLALREIMTARGQRIPHMA